MILRYCKEISYPYNFGDYINSVIFKYFTQENIEEECCFDTEFKDYSGKKTILGAGSIIQHSNSNDIVYGTGIMNPNMEMINLPKKVKSVRGPLTKEFLEKRGVSCPEVYGDPVLLLPFIYDPQIQKKYKVGIICHYLHKKDLPEITNKDKEYIIIDIENPDWKSTVKQIKSCEMIFSSSLHGIVIGDAYNVPSYYMEIYDGYNQYKYKDYYFSVMRDFFAVKFYSDLDKMIEQTYTYKCKIDVRKMIESFPFIDNKIREDSLKKIDNGFLSYLQK